jgi:hypothetical protein
MVTFQSRINPARRRNPILQYVGGFIVGVMIALAICFTLALVLAGPGDAASYVMVGLFPILGTVLGIMGTLTVARAQRY